MGIITTKTSNRRQFTRIKYFLLLNIISVTKLKEETKGQILERKNITMDILLLIAPYQLLC
jgi:hypothetical protein